MKKETIEEKKMPVEWLDQIRVANPKCGAPDGQGQREILRRLIQLSEIFINIAWMKN